MTWSGSRSASGGGGDDPSIAALEVDLRENLPAVLALNSMGGFIWDLASDLVFADPGALAVFGLEPDEFDGRMSTLHRLMRPEQLTGLMRRADDVFADREAGSSHGSYFQVRLPDGSFRWAHTQATIQRDEAGAALTAVGLIRDASEELRQVTQQAVLKSERKHQSDAVQASTAALAQALTVEDVLAALTSNEILGPVGAVGISLTVLEQGRLRRLAAAGMSAEYLRDLEFGRLDDARPVAEGFRTRKPLFLTRADLSERYPVLWPYIRTSAFTASAVLPLIAQARLTGVLAILYEDKEEFSPEEQNLLVALAATVAQSFQRAVLYDEEHAMAVGLQEAMLPASIPEVPGLEVAVRYRPARTGHQIGGDWYDVVPLPDGRVGLVVGDVQGHDIQAAAVMGQLRTALRAYATEGHSPASLVLRASRFLKNLDTECLATCIYVELDPASGGAWIVSAGHPGPLVRHGDGRSSRPAVESGLPLGLPEYSEGPYPVTYLRLGPEDVLLLCTDGLLEFRGSDIDAGERQIQALLDKGPRDLDQLAESIVATIEARQGQEDDVVLLLGALTP